jgi:UPF0042 nucleotide-binding protein
MQFIVVTGMSGAGKSTTLKFLEDAGFFCVDNLPPALIGKFAEVCYGPDSELTKVALGVDVRAGSHFETLFAEIEKLKLIGITMEIVFLESNNEILIKRFKETRRKHPLVDSGRIEDGIDLERGLLEPVKNHADIIIDTTNLLARELKLELTKALNGEQKYNNLIITVLSFGFKYGIPSDSDLVFDVRFIPNPYYKAELRGFTGNDQVVQDFVMQWDVSKDFIDKLEDMIKFLIPNYIQEGKNQLVISIGCTGGKHRSVTLANELTHRLDSDNYSVHSHHRDIEKDSLRGK